MTKVSVTFEACHSFDNCSFRFSRMF